jgi:phenylacetate-coenzyme A ligase PaaK-like adenylate-forming protein
MVMLKDTWQKATINFRIYAYYRKFKKESRLPAEEVHKIQFTRLKKLLCDVYQTHPFYQERFDASQFNPFKMADLSDIKKVPVLEKEDYRDFVKSQVEKGEKRYQNWYDDTTGGSTGIPMRVLRNWDERSYFGILKRHVISFTDPVENMVEMYLKVKPSVVYANKTHLVQMALYCNQNKIELPKPHLCISFAETMDERSRAVIEKCYGAESLMQIYGTIEFSVIAFQIKGEDCYNWSHTTNILEVLDENGLDTNYGTPIITDLFIRSFPMIRYNLGDILETEIKDGLPIIKKIYGRNDDEIIFADGKRLPWHNFAMILERRRELKQFRVIQEDYNLIRIVVAMESEADKSAVENAILTDLREKVRNEGMEYIIDFVDQIPPDPNGKLRMLISKVN